METLFSEHGKNLALAIRKNRTADERKRVAASFIRFFIYIEKIQKIKKRRFATSLMRKAGLEPARQTDT